MPMLLSVPAVLRKVTRPDAGAVNLAVEVLDGAALGAQAAAAPPAGAARLARSPGGQRAVGRHICQRRRQHLLILERGHLHLAGAGGVRLAVQQHRAGLAPEPALGAVQTVIDPVTGLPVPVIPVTEGVTSQPVVQPMPPASGGVKGK
jgi:hypothetical protein